MFTHVHPFSPIFHSYLNFPEAPIFLGTTPAAIRVPCPSCGEAGPGVDCGLEHHRLQSDASTFGGHPPTRQGRWGRNKTWPTEVLGITQVYEGYNGNIMMIELHNQQYTIVCTIYIYIILHNIYIYIYCMTCWGVQTWGRVHNCNV